MQRNFPFQNQSTQKSGDLSPYDARIKVGSSCQNVNRTRGKPFQKITEKIMKKIPYVSDICADKV
jgi:hypothetical protein